jgi:translation elongation factor EF-1alpha
MTVQCKILMIVVQGQTRQHARLLNLLGVRQLAVGVNKMDSDTAGYKQDRYEEIQNEMKHMLTKVGWKKDFVEGSVPFLPISGWMGDNLIKKSENMAWWKGVEIKSLSGKSHHVDTLLDYLNKVRQPLPLISDTVYAGHCCSCSCVEQFRHVSIGVIVNLHSNDVDMTIL